MNEMFPNMASAEVNKGHCPSYDFNSIFLYLYTPIKKKAVMQFPIKTL